jgi:hypothetical protein
MNTPEVKQSEYQTEKEQITAASVWVNWQLKQTDVRIVECPECQTLICVGHEPNVAVCGYCGNDWTWS